MAHCEMLGVMVRTEISILLPYTHLFAGETFNQSTFPEVLFLGVVELKFALVLFLLSASP